MILSPAEERSLRDYAAGRTSWSMLRQSGFESYLDVLAGLGELGLRPPMAPEAGRERNVAWLREALETAGR